MSPRPTALIADDEPLLREDLARKLAVAWPELDVVAQARNGREAVKHFEARRPDVCFLDVRMPGLSGVEAAHHIGSRAPSGVRHRLRPVRRQGVRAGRSGLPREAGGAGASRRNRGAPQGAPAAPRSRRRTPRRCCSSSPHSSHRLQSGAAPAPLRWIRAQVGQTLRMIPVDEIDYLRSDAKYTLIAWRGDAGRPGEALVRIALKELVAQLDPEEFAQVHRSVVRQPAGHQPRHPRRQRNGRHSPEGPQGGAAGQPQLPPPVPPDVRVRRSSAHAAPLDRVKLRRSSQTARPAPCVHGHTPGHGRARSSPAERAPW